MINRTSRTLNSLIKNTLMEKMKLAYKVMIHLGRYCNTRLEDDRIAPEGLTQTGIAMEMGLSRNHASVLLLKLEGDGYVYEKLCRIRYSRTGLKRKAYGLTPKGLVEYERILEELKQKGIDEKDLIGAGNINLYSGEQIDEISDADMEIIGMMCVLGIGIRKDSLTRVPRMVPFDGKISSLRIETMQRVINRNSEDTIRHWHSLAADFCLEKYPDIHRRIKHLVLSERFLEAKRLAIKNRFYIMDNPRKIVVPALMDLSKRYPQSEIPYISAMTATRLDLLNEAMISAKILESKDKELGMAVKSEIMLQNGQLKDANALALDSYRGDVETSIALSKTMMASGNYEQSLFFLRTARDGMRKKGCMFRMNEALLIESKLMRKMGRTAESVRLDDIAETISETVKGDFYSIREQYSSSDYPNRRCIDRGYL